MRAKLTRLLTDHRFLLNVRFAPLADSCTAVWQCEEMSLPFEVATV